MNASPQRRTARVDGYGLLPRLLHWSLAFVIVAAFATSFIAHLPGLRRPVVVGWHGAFGLAAWVLTLCLLAWRGLGRAPAPLPTHFAWQVATRRALAIATYALLVLVPVSGYLQASAQGAWVRILNATFLPALPLSDELGALLLRWQLHSNLALALYGVLAVHIGITLYHHVVIRDRTLARMLDGD